MDEISTENLYSERTNELPEEMPELTLGDGSWSGLLETHTDSKNQWGIELPLSEELRKLDEEQKQQIAEARAWIEEEEAVDELLRKDIAELQLAKQKNHEEAIEEICGRDIGVLHFSKHMNELTPAMRTPDIPQEVVEKIRELEGKVKSLEDQLHEKTLKVAQISDLYSELLNKLNESRERSLATDREFKASFSRIKEDYAEVEALLKSEIDRYKSSAKHLELKLTEKELEVSDLKQEREELLKEKSNLETMCNESSTSLESFNKYMLKLKVQLKNVKTERDTLKKEMINVEDIELIKERLTQIEEERNALLREKENAEDLEQLRDRVTLLEEEKGNLQLQVIDLDEIKEAANKTRKHYADLENSFVDLKNSATFLEIENQRVIENYEKAESKIREQQTIIDRFLKSAQESEEQKIIAVMRSVELEEQLSFRDKELSQLKESFSKEVISGEEILPGLESKKSVIALFKSTDETLGDKIRFLQEEKINNEQYIQDLRNELSKVESTLQNYQAENSSLLSMVNGLKTRETSLKKEMSLPATTNAPGSEKDTFYQKYKKLVANYKLKAKLCKEFESKLEIANSDLNKKEDLIIKIISEKNNLESCLSTSHSLLSELNKETEEKSAKIKDLISLLEQLCNVDEDERGTYGLDSAKLKEVVENWKTNNEANIHVVQKQVAQMNLVLLNVAKLEGELEELKKSLREKDDAISELEEERAKLSDVVKFNEKELEMLRAMYEKVSEKNEHFYTDLMSIEKEMANGKTELLSRLEVVTQNYDKCLNNLQERENYIETLEQDIVTMKTKIYNIESGMDERHKILRETSDQLMAKFQAAEIMSQTFEKYKIEVESKIESLEVEKKRAEENEFLLRELVSKLEADRDFVTKENDACTIRVEELLKEREKFQSRIESMMCELDTLRDIRNSYNSTLDKIEELNSELTQTAMSFELKNQRLELLEQERMELVNKLTDVEDAFSDLQEKYDECIDKNNILENEISVKNKRVEDLEQEKVEALNKINSIEHKCKGLERDLIEIMDKNISLESDLSVKNRSLLALEQERLVCVDKMNCLQHSCNKLDGKIQECAEKNTALELEITNKRMHLSDANKKIFDLETQLVESAAMCASLQDELTKMEKNLIEIHQLKEGKKHMEEMQQEQSNRWEETLSTDKKQDGQEMCMFTWIDQGAALDNAFGGDTKDEEDGWGWMAQEAALEHDHKHSEVVKIQDLTNKVAMVTEERDEYLNELTATKTKCQKLMKKIKEIKTLNESLERSKSDIKVGFSDLDFAMQEELRAENDKLQTKVDDITVQVNLLKNEKENLTKRLDTLVSANEQLIDLKERQDLEVQMWQRKSNQLMNEVKCLKLSLESNETNEGGEMSQKFASLVKENEELNLILETKKRELKAKDNEIDSELPEKFAALTCENEELTAMLNLQKRDQETTLNEYKEKFDSILVEKESILKRIDSKDHYIQELTLKLGDPELPTRYTSLNLELDHIKTLLNEKEMELNEVIRERDLLTSKKLAHFSQQTDISQEEFQDLKLFSLQSTKREDILLGEVEKLRITLHNLSEERHNLQGYISRMEEELLLRNVDGEAHLIATKERDDLASNLVDAKREASLWKQKAEDLKKEYDAKEKLCYNAVKISEENFQQTLLAKEEENAHLICSLSAKEQNLKEMIDEALHFKSECERLKCIFSVEKEALEEELKRLITQLTITKDHMPVEDINFLNQMVNDLQKELNDSLKDNCNKVAEIDSLRKQVLYFQRLNPRTLEPSETEEDHSSKSLMVENLLKDKETELESLRSELKILLKREAEIYQNEDVAVELKEKDSEIGRLTRTVVDMQERLLRMEEGKLMASINDLERKLDQALYTVHIRDVRCEELTEEIMQLLEERDMLQFRLAESLRLINAFSNTKDDATSTSSSPAHISSQYSSSPVNEKLNKLRHEYRRDPTVQIESEHRHMQHMQLYSDLQASKQEDANTSADYGFFNWFFSGSSSSPSGSEIRSHSEGA